jgi:hypothetical protein
VFGILDGLLKEEVKTMNQETADRHPEFRTDFRYAIVAGWLILPALYLLFNLFSVGSVVISFNPLKMTGQELLVYIIYLFLALFYLFIAYNWLKRKKQLPLLMISAYVINILLNVNAWLAGAGGLLGIGISLLWIVYFSRSRRVKATFTR